MKKDSINALENIAQKSDLPVQNGCIQCNEPLLFAFQDKNHQFSITLSNILECLAFAEKEGAIPPIDPAWWGRVNAFYSKPNKG